MHEAMQIWTCYWIYCSSAWEASSYRNRISHEVLESTNYIAACLSLWLLILRSRIILQRITLEKHQELYYSRHTHEGGRCCYSATFYHGMNSFAPSEALLKGKVRTISWRNNTVYWLHGGFYTRPISIRSLKVANCCDFLGLLLLAPKGVIVLLLEQIPWHSAHICCHLHSDSKMLIWFAINVFNRWVLHPPPESERKYSLQACHCTLPWMRHSSAKR